jgi:hypothetical protein
MASAGQVPQKQVWDMLDKCAPGWSPEPKLHHIWIHWGGRTYASFPKHPQIDVGHVRKMVRHLQIDKKCSQGEIEQLR